MLPSQLAQRFQASYCGDEWQAFCRLNRGNRAPFSAFIRLQDGAVLSLSPERFIQLREARFRPARLKVRCRVWPIRRQDARQAEAGRSPKIGRRI
ncbi:hypothetical protein DMH17_09945 [Raoultella planticola]|nr:hypothetical protein [Raoultella planticola]